MKPFRALLAVAAFTALAACASITEAPAGRFDAGGGMTVQLGRAWSDISPVFLEVQKPTRLLTVDGPFLNRLYLVGGLEPGKTLVRQQSKDRPNPAYAVDLTETELVEFVADSVAAMGYERVETRALRPETLGDAEGVRFDLVAQTKEGLDISGSAVLAEQGGKLYVALFLAPTEHYFAALTPEVEKILASAAIGG